MDIITTIFTVPSRQILSDRLRSTNLSRLQVQCFSHLLSLAERQFVSLVLLTALRMALSPDDLTVPIPEQLYKCFVLDESLAIKQYKALRDNRCVTDMKEPNTEENLFIAEEDDMGVNFRSGVFNTQNQLQHNLLIYFSDSDFENLIKRPQIYLSIYDME